jgi:hypothetical protein
MHVILPPMADHFPRISLVAGKHEETGASLLKSTFYQPLNNDSGDKGAKKAPLSPFFL